MQRASYERELARARQEAHDEALRSVAERGACRLCEATLVMGRVVVDEERGTEHGENLLALTQSTCPLMLAKYGKFLPWLDCAELTQRVEHYYDPRFEDAVPGLPANETRRVNFALVHLLKDCRTFLRIPFCAAEQNDKDEARWRRWAHYLSVNPFQQELSKEEKLFEEKMDRLHDELKHAGREPPSDDVTPRMVHVDE